MESRESPSTFYNESPGKFRLCAKKVYLTYPQCDVSKSELLWNIERKFFATLKDYFICQERHMDGNLHLHALFIWSKEIDVKKADKFDFESKDGRNYHPNIGRVGNSKNDIIRLLKYMSKYDKEPLSTMDLETYLKESTKSNHSAENFAEAIAATNAAAAEALLKANEPKCFVTNYNNVKAFIASKDVPKPYVPKDYGTVPNVPKQFLEWQAQFGSDERTKLLIVNGPTMCGKSTYFRSLGNHAYMKGTWNADAFTKNKDFIYTVIDDVNWTQFKDFVINNRGCFLGDGEVTITDKYRHKTTVDFTGKPCVILCNDNMAGSILESFDNESYTEQVIYVELKKGVKLWKTEEVPCTPGQHQEELLLDDLFNGENEWTLNLSQD